MVRHHVPQCARLIKVSAALFDADGFRDSDLNVVYISMVPDRLEDPIAEAKDQDVLDGFLPEVVINTVDLIFRQHFPDLLIEGLGRIKVAAKGLFKYYAAPMAVFLFRQSCRAEIIHDDAKKRRARGKIEKVVSFSVVFCIHFSQCLRQARVKAGFVEFAAYVVQAAQQPVAQLGLNLGSGKVLELLAHLLAERFSGIVVPANADNGKFTGKQVALCQVVESREQFAGRKVARGAENHHHARAGLAWFGFLDFLWREQFSIEYWHYDLRIRKRFLSSGSVRCVRRISGALR